MLRNSLHQVSAFNIGILAKTSSKYCNISILFEKEIKSFFISSTTLQTCHHRQEEEKKCSDAFLCTRQNLPFLPVPTFNVYYRKPDLKSIIRYFWPANGVESCWVAGCSEHENIFEANHDMLLFVLLEIIPFLTFI